MMFKSKQLKTAIIITKNPEEGGYRMKIEVIGDKPDKEMAAMVIGKMFDEFGIDVHVHSHL